MDADISIRPEQQSEQAVCIAPSRHEDFKGLCITNNTGALIWVEMVSNEPDPEPPAPEQPDETPAAKPKKKRK